MFLNAIPQLQVHIMVRKEQLTEYNYENHPPTANHATKYIEAEEGRNFAMSVRTDPQMARVQQDCVAAHIFFDGKHVGGSILETGRRQASQWFMRDCYERNTASGSTSEKYCFASLQTNDNPVGTAKLADYKDLGEVEVRCYWARKTAGTHTNDSQSTASQDVSASIPEKCLKGRAISSRASLGAVEQRAHKVNYANLKYPYGITPFAKFTFKCRSRRDLQIEDIIPRTPSPAPLEQRDPNTLTLEESRELLRRLLQRKEQREQKQQIEIKKEGQKIKKEGQKKRERSETVEAEVDDEDEGGIVVTGEGPARKRGRQSTDSGVEIVDLTAD
ncbi:hypothetical protein CB0940_12244 [Cercospora beticola]|uniref:DUF7918 domain-containing protein n=1 Tax=Cercospora beticola TaxID=122368 RepID=A0A2G5H5Q0_CERBT|nr:hypothetical protein CB0940_12244 [Cercospora beticola]PIA87869.1 hypothetical protein CB0940_12244 [Cercospora beticola]WPB04516.1 hypothetical protein RHO25_009162 [Cercospora beticola]CAK1364259.1 unnamed protein product [Cercospora beticola]